MHIWIVRHGEAEPRAASDPERALTARGWEQARQVGRWLRRSDPVPLRIAASSYRRARETAAAIAAALSLPVAETSMLEPDTEPAALLDWLERQGPGLVLVSHQPLVSAFAGLLVEGRVHGGPPMGTGSVAHLEADPLAAGCVHLRGVRHAAELASEAGEE